MESGFWGLGLPEEIGGTTAPPSLVWSTGEMVLGAQAPIWMYCTGPSIGSVVFKNANGVARDVRIAEIMVERLWGATMVLTEPDAGSDVGAGKTFATPNEDGSWNISGVKRFITSAESDLQENIMHLVLARPKGVEGIGGPGTKGLSLFLVPKYHFDHQTGELTGERNGVYVTNVEHKMGIKVSNTCELTFGDPQIGGGEPAQGWLLGEVHDGIAPDVRRHRERPHDGRHEGHCDAVDRLPQRAGVRQGARPGCRPDAGVPTRPLRVSRSRTTPTCAAR
jgi:alkylation response protein AidB-like acyl-CoA dehydrogenase